MKLLVCPFLFFTVLFSNCIEDNERDGVEQSKDILGTWQQFENAYSPGSGIIVEDVKNGPVFSFSEDGSFVYYGSSDIEGSWREVNKKEIELDYKGDLQNVSYEYVITLDVLTLTPSNPRCVERCYSKWKRVR